MRRIYIAPNACVVDCFVGLDQSTWSRILSELGGYV